MPSADPEIAAVIRERNRFDIELYQFGQELFEANLRRNKEVIEQISGALDFASDWGPLKKICYSNMGRTRFLASKFASAL